MIAVIDYGMGNLRSVQKALQAVGGKAQVTDRSGDIQKAEKIVFPGVGAFGDAMKELRSRRLVEPLKNAIAEGKPFLGLCLGMQLLFERSDEAPAIRGLGVLKGVVKRFRFTKKSHRTLKIPHMGWNTIKIKSQRSKFKNKTQPVEILKGVPNGSFMYFVHSYYVEPKDASVILTTTDYGIRFVSGVRRSAIFGFQFHPEKSQRLGLRILRNFVNL